MSLEKGGPLPNTERCRNHRRSNCGCCTQREHCWLSEKFTSALGADFKKLPHCEVYLMLLHVLLLLLQLSTLWAIRSSSLCSPAPSSDWTSPCMPETAPLCVGDMATASAVPPWAVFSISPGDWFITINLYFFQLRALESLGQSDCCLRLNAAFLLLLDSVGELGWQSDLSGL